MTGREHAEWTLVKGREPRVGGKRRPANFLLCQQLHLSLLNVYPKESHPGLAFFHCQITSLLSRPPQPILHSAAGPIFPTCRTARLAARQTQPWGPRPWGTPGTCFAGLPTPSGSGPCYPSTSSLILTGSLARLRIPCYLCLSLLKLEQLLEMSFAISV